MPTEKTATIPARIPVDHPLPMRELAAVLVKHYGLHEGRYDILIEFKIGIGAVGAEGKGDDDRSPGAIIGVSRVGLIPSRKAGSTTVDAGIVNPTRKAPRKK